jgi:hypothetical protein
MPLPTPTAAVATAALAALAGTLAAQASIHHSLAERMRDAAPTDRLPVYFVLADRLEYDHWFPRVNRMPIDERRRAVMAELKAHAARTQQRLLDVLQRRAAQGDAASISANWLGNFVHCDATTDAIREAAALPDVAEARINAAWPLELVEDGARSDAGHRDGAAVADGAAPRGAFADHLPAARTAPAHPGGPTPGDGPINTRATEVWALGFQGQGVVIMNADSGIAPNHGDLVNRLWFNPGEIPGNNIDDDNNGYIDDVIGWNFFNNSPSINDPGTGHGSSTAGCLVGDGSCSGTITGQAPQARVMTARLGTCCPQSGPVNPAGEVAQWDAIQYAIQMGAHIQTSSHSYKNGFVPPPNYWMHRQVGDASLAAGLIRTNSPSNNGAECNNPTSLVRRPFNISAPGNLPPPYLDPAQTLRGRKGGVIGVGAHDVNSNQRVGYSPCGPTAWYLPDLLAVNPSYPLENWGPLINDYPWQGGAMQGLIKPDVTGPTHTLTVGATPCGLQTFSGTSNATPHVAGCMALWKSANMSLKPEDMAMVLHQSSTESGSIPGKENDFGAGRINAFAGLHLALCTHRVNGEPAWSVTHTAGQSIAIELDGIPNSLAAVVVGTTRLPIRSLGGVLGVGGAAAVLWQGQTDGNGDVVLSFPISPVLAGLTVFTQGFIDGRSVTGGLLSSNVIETRFDS